MLLAPTGPELMGFAGSHVGRIGISFTGFQASIVDGFHKCLCKDEHNHTH